MIDPGTSLPCGSSEQPLNWNVQGARGPQGPQGPAGPGVFITSPRVNSNASPIGYVKFGKLKVNILQGSFPTATKSGKVKFKDFHFTMKEPQESLTLNFTKIEYKY